jgi:hypothetical protein
MIARCSQWNIQRYLRARNLRQPPPQEISIDFKRLTYNPKLKSSADDTKPAKWRKLILKGSMESRETAGHTIVFLRVFVSGLAIYVATVRVESSSGKLEVKLKSSAGGMKPAK